VPLFNFYWNKDKVFNSGYYLNFSLNFLLSCFFLPPFLNKDSIVGNKFFERFISPSNLFLVCLKNALADVHFLAKLGLSVSPDFVAPRQEKWRIELAHDLSGCNYWLPLPDSGN
jgi:hypothetical protein